MQRPGSAPAPVFAQVMEVLALRYDFRGVSMTLHNFANRPKTVTVDPKVKGGNMLNALNRTAF